MIVGKKALPAKDLKELIAWLKANPDKASVASRRGALRAISPASPAKRPARGQFVPIAARRRRCRTWSPARSICMTSPASNFFALAQGRRVKRLRGHGEERALPRRRTFPTVDEAGLPGFHASLWYGALGAEGHAEGHHRAAQRRDASMRWRRPDDAQALRRARLEIPPREQQTPEASRAFHKAEADKWWPIIKAANIKGE